MKSWIPRAGAFAPVAIALVTLFGADSTGAKAQDHDALRYIAEPVIQPLPGSQAAPDKPSGAATSNAASLAQLVGDMPVNTALPADLQCLAEAIYFEARGEVLDGQLAVGRVVVNRAASGRYPRDYCGVVRQPYQFSFVKGGHIPRANEASDAWRRAKAVAQIADRGLWDSEVGGALYFHARYVQPQWARRKVQLAQIDSHIFYR
jgi:spore germination cell wall hydrolase CwlJ-like protein